MSFCNSFSSSFAPFDPNGIDFMTFWRQLPNEQRLENSVFDHGSPPMKRRKISSVGQFTNENHPAVNQPNGKMFYKTRLCIKFKMGQCKNGENCNFAHGVEDLRKPPSNWQELIGSRMEDKMNNREDDDDKMINRIKLCRKFYNGEECPYGARCNFSHVQPPKFRENSTPFRDDCRECSSISSIGTIRPPMVQARTDQSNTHYVPSKSVSAMDIDPIPSKAYAGVASTQSVQPNNGNLKWNLNKKINRIYGDWIDDQPLILANEEEN